MQRYSPANVHNIPILSYRLPCSLDPLQFLMEPFPSQPCNMRCSHERTPHRPVRRVRHCDARYLDRVSCVLRLFVVASRSSKRWCLYSSQLRSKERRSEVEMKRNDNSCSCASMEGVLTD
ncbi:Hypothetical protein, putative [Bodo saltans]|uniref:Uncharacterized protein n=1 Tax=Bodo saltans TaxID=75058 RepID=A0A0S4J7R2_BODSA|nr:Hypothetical protein, putative [Bodo saltans]|eukprot:CUG86350.1 Hypothetical protein, putative [Bodo saltans]